MARRIFSSRLWTNEPLNVCEGKEELAGSAGMGSVVHALSTSML